MPDIMEKYRVILNIFLFLFTLFCLVVFMGKQYWKKKERRKKYRKNYISQRNFGFCGFMIGIISLIALNVYVGNYTIGEHFFWEYDENVHIDDIFAVYVRKKAEENLSQNMDALHMEWLYQDISDEGSTVLTVTRSLVDVYENNVKAVYSAIPFREDSIFEEKAGEEFKEKLQQYKSIIQDGKYDSKPSSELWDGFIMGQEVCNVNNTSENVYQRAILAEAAHYKAYLSRESVDVTSLYLNGAIGSFEEALQFVDRDAGNGIKYTDKDIAEQIGVMMTRESWQYRGKSAAEDIEKHIHYSVFGYVCFDYALSDMQCTDEKYVINLYYEGLCCLEFMPYVSDEQYRAELARKELERWEKLNIVDDNTFEEVYSVEGKSREELERVKENLKNYLNGE